MKKNTTAMSIKNSLVERAFRSNIRQLADGLLGLLHGYLFRIRCKMTLKRLKCGSWLRVYGKVYIKGNGSITIGEGCLFMGDTTKPVCLSTLNKNAEIRLGNNVGLNGVTIQCSELVEIGDDSNIAAYYITDSQNHSLSIKRRSDPSAPIETAPVIIKRNVWISVLTTVLQGVTIGENSVIGANSLVAKDIPSNYLAFGVPARPVKQLDIRGKSNFD
jgi:acetyltransferase-like isoleucine patch superfamily enzyme